MTKDNDSDVDRAKDGELVGFLEETTLALQESTAESQVSYEMKARSRKL